MTDRKSWTVKNDAILVDLLTLMELTEEEKQCLVALQPQAQAISPELADAFYQRLTAHPLTAEYVTGMIDARKNTLQQWFMDLFSGTYGEDYVLQRLKIGQVHVQIGLPVRYPLAMIDVVLEHGLKVAHQSQQPKIAAKAFRKLLALDMAIFNQSYEDTQLSHLAETVGNERLARRVLAKG